MAIIFNAVPFGASRRQRNHRIETIQGLNRSLLIDTEHRCVLQWIHVQTDDVGGLLFKMSAALGVYWAETPKGRADRCHDSPVEPPI